MKNKKLILILAGVVIVVTLGVALAVALRGTKPTGTPATGGENPPAGETPTTPAEPEVKPRVEPVVIPEAEVATAKPGSCLVLEEQYCGSAATSVKKSDSTRLPGIIFTAPKGAKIFAPFDGVIVRTVLVDSEKNNIGVISVVKGKNVGLAEMSNDTAPYISYISMKTSLESGLDSGSAVKKGQVIGVVDTADKVFPNFVTTPSNFVISPSLKVHSAITDASKITAVEYLSKMFSLINK